MELCERHVSALAACLCALLLSGCSTSRTLPDGRPDRDRDISAIPDAEPRQEAPSRYGNPASYVVFGRRYHVMAHSRGFRQRGIASWYGTKFHGRRTSSGEPYDMHAMTAAHKSLPLPTYVRVNNLRNGRSIVVRVNDRGPFVDGRIIDLSYTAARKLDIVAHGTAPVEIIALDPAAPAQTQALPVAATAPVPSEPAAAAELTDEADTSSTAQVYVQVGAFSQLHNAQRLRTRLQDSFGDDIHIESGRHQQRTIYRVRIGPLASLTEADAMADRLLQNGHENPRIVVY